MAAAVPNNQRTRPATLSTSESGSSVRTTNNTTSPPATTPEQVLSPTSAQPPSKDRPRSGDDAWLTAHDDPVASMRTSSGCVTLADLQNDGDYKLVVADFGTGDKDMKLKLYKVRS